MAVTHHSTSTPTLATTHAGTITNASFALSSGTDLVMIVFVVYEGGQVALTVSGVTWNTTETATKILTQANAGGSTTDEYIDIWKVVNPTATTADIVATFSASNNDAAIWCQCYEGYSAIGDTDGTAVDDGDEPTATVVTTVANSMVVGAMSRSNARTAGDSWTGGADVTKRADASVGDPNGVDIFGGDMVAATTGSYAFTADYSYAAVEDFAVAAIEVQPAASAGIIGVASGSSTASATISKEGGSPVPVLAHHYRMLQGVG